VTTSLHTAQQRLHDAIHSAAQALEHERLRLQGDPAIRAAYDQGRIDELTRIASLITIRLNQLPTNTAGRTELHLLRQAILEATTLGA